MNWRLLAAGFFFALVTSCSYNPFIANNHTTGSVASTAIGAGIGFGTTALLSAPRPVVGLATLGGGALGYYVSTQRFAAGGIIQAGGQVYQVGDYVGIDIPTEKLFEPNSDEFLPQATPILESVEEVLERYPNNNILVSGNSSGFSSNKYEQPLTEARARQVTAYLWAHGINQFQGNSNNMRKLTYVGYGSHVPIANNLTNKGIRANSRIQITSYPSGSQLLGGKGCRAFANIGANDP